MACGEGTREMKESGEGFLIESGGEVVMNGEEEKLVLYSKETLVSVEAENQGFRYKQKTSKTFYRLNFRKFSIIDCSLFGGKF